MPDDHYKLKTFDIALIIATIVVVAIVAALALSRPWPPELRPATISMQVAITAVASLCDISLQ
jgi:hypothetical protein